MALATTLVGLCCVSGVAQGASPAWKLLAVTGPTNLPPRQSEVQRVTVEAEGGSFALGQLTAEGEGTVTFATGSARLTSGSNQVTILSPGEGIFSAGQLISGTGIPVGTTIVSVSGSVLTVSANATGSRVTPVTGASKEVVGLTVSSGGFHPGDAISGANIPAGTIITSVGASSLILSDFPTGGGTIALTGTETTAPIAYDASAGEVQEALEALLALGPASVSVTGGPGGSPEVPYIVDFGGPDGGGPFADQNVNSLTGDAGALLGAHAAVHVFTTVPGGPGTGEIVVEPANIGGAQSQGLTTLRVGPLPSNIHTTGPGSGPGWKCSEASSEPLIVCRSIASVSGTTPGEPVSIPVAVDSTTASSSSAPVEISGGGAAPANFQLPIEISAMPAPFGTRAFWAGAFDADGNLETQAGAHPFSAQTFFLLNTVRALSGQIVPTGVIEEALVDLPPGFSGNPLVTPRCPQSQVTPPETVKESALCGPAMSIGTFGPIIDALNIGAGEFAFGIYNDIPVRGAAAEFSTQIFAPVQSLLASVRSKEDFGVRITAPNIANLYKIYGSYAALEGEPIGAHGQAFLTSPTNCAEEALSTPYTNLKIEAYELPGVFDESLAAIPPVTGCDQLSFDPSFGFQPSSSQGSSPVGATAHLHLPQESLADPNRLATPHLKKVVATLPKGLDVNPSSANGLQACTEAQVGYEGPGAMPNPTRFNEEPVGCPDGSKLGTFTVKTPLLEEEVEGIIYLAAQEANPFDSLIALYLVIENERFGLTLKLPGEVRPNPTTGQLTAVFDNNPQVAFEDLTLHFRGGGPRATLAMPEICGTYKATGELTPWSAPESGPPAQIEEPGFTVASNCASSDSARPFSPSFEAGTTDPRAGSYSPLVIKIARKDGEQELKSLNFTLPLGLTAKLAGIPYCSEAAIREAEGKSGRAEQASPSCPSASRLGSVDAAAGVGSEPFHTDGFVYLSGPYKGAPLSTVTIIPAVAGPFDLGDVVVRAPAFVDLETALITVESDPLPTMLKGIPLKVRSVGINLDRGQFFLNPTSCEPMSLRASIGGSSGATANPSNRFQVGGCDKLKFKPKLRLSLKGSTKHAGHPALKAVLTYPKNGAYSNIARAQVNLPHSEFIDQGNLDKTCTRPVLLEGKCTKRSIYGKAKAWTPLLDKPLEGPVYLVGGYGYKLPALVAELNGQIRVVLKGKVDSGPNHGIRNTFEAVPDAPVEKFVLEMKGGRKYSLLENSENLCAKPQRATARFTAQNGLVDQYKPLIAIRCPRKHRKHVGHKKG